MRYAWYIPAHMRLFIVFTLLFSTAAFATPAQVIMIRHAEKPADESHNGLSKRGWKRAYALVDFFMTEKKVTRYGPPVAIYGFGQTRPDSSVRGIQTVEPLAEELGMKVIKKYIRDDYEAAAEEILTKRAYDGKMVLVSWEHDALTPFAEALGLEDAPKWKSKAFDRAWIIDFSKKGEVVRFRDIPQQLLSGDSEE